MPSETLPPAAIAAVFVIPALILPNLGCGMPTTLFPDGGPLQYGVAIGVHLVNVTLGGGAFGVALNRGLAFQLVLGVEQEQGRCAIGPSDPEGNVGPLIETEAVEAAARGPAARHV